MAQHILSDHFDYFFQSINPAPTFDQTASREYNNIKALLEDPSGLANELAPRCFLQGSYRQQTAIYSINDIDIVALCSPSYPPARPAGITLRSWGRDAIFNTIAAPLLNDGRYRTKVSYNGGSMCVKIDLGIKVEILPVVYAAETTGNFYAEPFYLYRPQVGRWEVGYARYHQRYLSDKNGTNRTSGNFIPAVKILKHINKLYDLQAVSFHIECLLRSLPDGCFYASLADYLTTIFLFIKSIPYDQWYDRTRVLTPCGERDIFTPSEWPLANWRVFHSVISTLADSALAAVSANDRRQAILAWQAILGSSYFPATTNP